MFSFKYILAILLSLVETSVRAEGKMSETDAYCEYINSSSGDQMLNDLTPTVMASYYQGGEANTETNPLQDTFKKSRLGLEYDLIGIPKAVLHNKIADASCESKVAVVALEAVSRQTALEDQVKLLTAERAGKIAANVTFKKGWKTLQESKEVFKKRMNSGAATMSDVISVNDNVTMVQFAISDNDMDIEKIEGDLKEAQENLEEIKVITKKARAENITMEQAQSIANQKQLTEFSLKETDSRLSSFNLSLYGGYQHIGGSSNPGNSNYVGAQLKISLGTVAESVLSKSKTTYDKWLQTKATKATTRLSKVGPEEKIKYLMVRQPFLESKFASLEKLVKNLLFEGNGLATTNAVRMFALKLAAEGELASSKAKLEVLRGGKQAEVSTKPVLATIGPVVPVTPVVLEEAPVPAVVPEVVPVPVLHVVPEVVEVASVSEVTAAAPEVPASPIMPTTPEIAVAPVVRKKSKVELLLEGKKEEVTVAPSWLTNDVPNYRRSVKADKPSQANVMFKILGESKNSRALKGGETRHQLGLMSRWQNQCNLVYAMIRLGPKPIIAVQEKFNPGQSTHEQCENHGYSTIKGKAIKPLSPIKPGETHTLSVAVANSEIQVWLDGELVWKGNGPVHIQEGTSIGFRSDNLDVTYLLSNSDQKEK